MIILGVIDHPNLLLRVERSADLTEKSSFDDKRDTERWDRSNRMSDLMIMKRAIPEAFRGTMSKKLTITKGFLKEIEKRFAKNGKA